MNQKKLLALWAAMFILCAGLGFISLPMGALKVFMIAAAVAFFIPPAPLRGEPQAPLPGHAPADPQFEPLFPHRHHGGAAAEFPVRSLAPVRGRRPVWSAGGDLHTHDLRPVLACEPVFVGVSADGVPEISEKNQITRKRAGGHASSSVSSSISSSISTGSSTTGNCIPWACQYSGSELLSMISEELRSSKGSSCFSFRIST